MGKMALFVLHCFGSTLERPSAEASDPRLLQECQSEGSGWPGDMKPENLWNNWKDQAAMPVLYSDKQRCIPDMKVLEKAMDGGRERERERERKRERDRSRWIVYIYIYMYMYMYIYIYMCVCVCGEWLQYRMKIWWNKGFRHGTFEFGSVHPAKPGFHMFSHPTVISLKNPEEMCWDLFGMRTLPT